MRLLQVATSLLLVCSTTLIGCATDDDPATTDSPATIGGAPTKQVKEDWSETLKLDEMTIVLHTEASGSGGLMATGPAGSQAQLQSKLAGARTARELYQRLKPGARVPAALENIDLSPSDDQPIILDSSGSEDVLPVAAAGEPAEKGAWANYWCKDWIDENQIAGTYYHKYDFCYENVTTNLSYDFIGVREAFFVAQMVSGAGTYRVYDKANGASTWVSRVNTTIQPGNWYAQQRWGGSSLIDVRFQLLDVQTDVFNWAMQSARTPMTAMPATQAGGSGTGEYVHFKCQFTNSWGWFEACMPINADVVVNSLAWNRCQLIGSETGDPALSIRAVERMTSTSSTMCNGNTLAYKACLVSTCNCNGMCPGWKPGS